MNEFQKVRNEENPCLNCDCYDSDLGGCTMPSIDRAYACCLEVDEMALAEEWERDKD